MAYTLSSSFTYTPDVVDFDAMNITETFPEASSFSFELSGSYNHSYSDSISGIPLAQQALWDDGQLSVPPTVESSRIYHPSSGLSSLNNSANNSINLGYPASRQFLAPPAVHHPRTRTQFQGSPLKDEYAGSGSGSDQQSEGYDDSSLQNSWVDDTRDHNGIMLLNDREHKDEQHLLFLQEMASANLSRGDSISLFAKLGDESDLSCDLFKEELNADEARDQSRMQSENSFGPPPSNNPSLPDSMPKKPIMNEIFSQEFLNSLKAPLVQQPPPPLESATNQNLLQGLHTIAAPTMPDDDVYKHVRDNNEGAGGERKESNEAYKRALKSFIDSLKVADPIKTPHKFAPQPLPILWNEPKIRSRKLPSFSLADYKDIAKTSLAKMSMDTLPTIAKTPAPSKQDSISSSPTNTHSIPNSTNSSPISSIATSPPVDTKPKLMSAAKTSTIMSALSNSEQQQHQDQSQESDQDVQQPRQQTQDKDYATQQKQEHKSNSDRIRRSSSIQNPHLAFDPTIPPSERVEEAKPIKTPLERRSMVQPMARNMDHGEDKDEENIGLSTTRRSEHKGSFDGSQPADLGNSQGLAMRKRRSLHQDLFNQDKIQSNGEDDGLELQKDQGGPEENPKPESVATQIPQYSDASPARRSTRPLSVNILPESLTSLNNYAMHQEVAQPERARKLMDEETEVSKPSGTQSLGRASGTRLGRSGSSSSGSMMSPATPTASNPYGTLSGRTLRQAGAGSQRLSLTGLSSVYTNSDAPEDGGDDNKDDELTAPFQSLTLSKLQTPPGAATRNSARFSPPSMLPVQHRRGLSSPDQESQRETRLPSPIDHYDDYYRSERDEQQFTMPRGLHSRQPTTERSIHDWEEDLDEPSQRRYQSKSMREPTSVHRSSPEFQKEQQRLRVQQQAREEVYGRGYSNNYGDSPDSVEDYQIRYSRLPASTSNNINSGGHSNGAYQQQQQHARHGPLSPSRDYFSSTTKSGAGSLRFSPPVSASTRSSDHYRRQSKDGHSLMPAPRISPPLTAMSTARSSTFNTFSNPGSMGNSGIGMGSNTPRRSLSNVAGVVMPTSSPIRRLSNNSSNGSTSGYVSALPIMGSGLSYGANNNGSLHARSASSGSATMSQRTSLYAPTNIGSGATAGTMGGAGLGIGMGAGPRGVQTLTDGVQSSVNLRRSSSTLIPSTRRTSGPYSSTSNVTIPTPMTSGIRGPSRSSAGGIPGPIPSSSSSSEYARVYVSPRSSISGASGGYGAGSGAGSSGFRTSQLMNDDGYSYKLEAPMRHSSLGVASGNAVFNSNSNISGLNRSNTMNARGSYGGMSNSASTSMLVQPSSSTSASIVPSPSQIRRTSSIPSGGSGGSSGIASYGGHGIGSSGSMTLGRSSGMAAHRQYQSSHQYQQPLQSYQRTSMYAYH